MGHKIRIYKWCVRSSSNIIRDFRRDETETIPYIASVSNIKCVFYKNGTTK